MGFATYTSIFQVGYLGLSVNALFALANAPLLVALGAAADPARVWPGLLVLALGIGPSTAAAFECFRRHAEDASTSPVRDFVAGYRVHGRRALAAWALVLALSVVLVTDLRWARGATVGALLTPVFVTLAGVTVAAALGLLVMVVRLPGTPLRSLAGAAVFLAVRRWYASLLNLALIGGAVVGVGVRPLLGLALLPAFTLYVVWANNSYAVVSALEGAGSRSGGR